jgi:glutamine---fructose-6-phosphate transaminase (isomerizing)
LFGTQLVDVVLSITGENKMCGIVGMVSKKSVALPLLTVLGRMEYRGYDSAGIALSGKDGLLIDKVLGPRSHMSHIISSSKINTGIAHTRWATHGRPEIKNAHPHVVENVAVVHNGIIENHAELRDELVDLGAIFCSDTDSEVIPHLIAKSLKSGNTPMQALRETCLRLKGDYAIGVVIEGYPELILATRKGKPPIVVGRGKGVYAISSDPSSLGGYCTTYAPIEEGDFVELNSNAIEIWDENGHPIERIWHNLTNRHIGDVLGGFEHHTRKEIAEQPIALRNTLTTLRELKLPSNIQTTERLIFIACGSSLNAACTARFIVEEASGLSCDLEVASEYRYRNAPIPKNSVAVFVSQSGETADTMACMDLMKSKGVLCIGIVNVEESSIGRGSDVLWPTRAGQEVGVAATKTFTCQIMAIALLGVAFGKIKNIDASIINKITSDLYHAPSLCVETEGRDEALRLVAKDILKEEEVLYMGRGWGASIACEASLKMKELSYIKSEAYAAGELKHGPIALIREGSPVIIHAPGDKLISKISSNAEEVKARGAHIIALTDSIGAEEISRTADRMIILPSMGYATCFSHAVAIQLLAYHVAVGMGRDVDRPRNLAKSVTVE